MFTMSMLEQIIAARNRVAVEHLVVATKHCVTDSSRVAAEHRVVVHRETIPLHVQFSPPPSLPSFFTSH